MAWQRFRVTLKGEAEPIEVATNARDWAAVVIDPGAPRAMDMTFRVVHSALLRAGVTEVPRNYDAFLEVLAGIPESLEDGDAGDDAGPLDPTPSVPSGG
jgi:hypothetical protein